jgi:hypothetical protein
VSRWSQLLDWLAGRNRSAEPAPDRHERREAARQRHRETDEPLWTENDLVPGPGGKREVEDVTPGTPGSFGGRRTIRDD